MSYGDLRPIDHLAAISTSNDEILIRPYDSALIAPIVKAIHESGIGLTAVPAKTSVLVKVPRLSCERRSELVRYCRKLAEGQRVAIRNIRRSLRKDKSLVDAEIDELVAAGLAEIEEMLAGKIERLSGI